MHKKPFPDFGREFGLAAPVQVPSCPRKPLAQVQQGGRNVFINCMNECGRLLEIPQEQADKLLLTRDPPVIRPEILIYCCECAFSTTSEQLLREN